MKIFLATALMLFTALANATVSLSNTRIIYNANSSSVTLPLNNNKQPAMMQIWVDSGDENSTPDNAQAPFIVFPPLFKMAANATQMVRVSYTGSAAAQDRESVYYFNMVEIPYVDTKVKDKNKIVLSIKTRVKLFYRPANLTGDANSAPAQLQFSAHKTTTGWEISATNPTPWYISSFNGQAMTSSGGKNFPMAMIAPKSTVSWKVSGLNSKPTAVKFTTVNDYGALVEQSASVK